MNGNTKGFPRQFGPNGCPIPVSDNQRCGQTQTLEIIKEFKQLYEDKMKQFDIEAGGDCLPGLQAKITLQQEWIRDLTEQNEMLVRAVEELEMEATDRVAMLEEKLRNSAQCGAEVMQKYRDFNFSINLDATFQKLVYLQSDVRNLLEFIRRVRDESNWSIEGLHFYDVTCKDLFGTPTCCVRSLGENGDIQKKYKMSEKLQEKEQKLRDLEVKINNLPKDQDLQKLSAKLNEKNDELNALKRSTLDMRNALTIEVAEKHDVILNLRRDVQQLEEQCRQSTKQTQFKDDIIKEMRKEIKLLKGQIRPPETLRSQSLPRSHEILEPPQILHECCPYVKDLCPLTLKNNAHTLRVKRLKNTSKRRHSVPQEMSSIKQHNHAFIFIREENPTHDYSSHSQESSSIKDQNYTPRAYKNFNDASLREVSASVSVPHVEFYSDSLVPTKCSANNQRKPRTKLTVNKILHEYYGIHGTVENYNETPKTGVVKIPKHVPVKTFVTNLEKKEKIQSRKDVNKTVSNDDNS